MKSKAAFTICAKNYLAQALTLKKSFLRNNIDSDFYIFLSDLPIKEISEIEGIVFLDESWIKGWECMAFKYNVIEFSTSIKPFCFNKLFTNNYDKVIYLDPDIYVTNTLNTIFDYLDDKSIVLSPHYCNIQTNYTGAVSEEEILFVGIYNLGFVGIKNNKVGTQIIDWWENRLSSKCYADKFESLHVDQRWIDFIPAFFPNDVFISHHMGINPAIWNLHERELIVDMNGKYYIKNINNGEIFDMLFFHFSGFDPFNPTVINRRHPRFNTEQFPSFIPLFNEYVEMEYFFGYDFYSKLEYSFNSFEDGENILPIHRRLFRINEERIHDVNPFLACSNFRKTLEMNNLLTGIKSNNFSTYSENEKKKKKLYENIILRCFKVIKKSFGIRYYSSFIDFIHVNSRLDSQGFLITKYHDK